MSLSAPWTTRSRIQGIERTRTFPPSFGISFFRASMGRYVLVISSSLICLRKPSTPLSSMASNVTPSIPGAPSFSFAIRYASCSVSILQTWTYNPQKRQAGSAFALTYRLLLRSCKLIGAFLISPCLPFRWNRYKQQGPFAPQALPRFLATMGPSKTLSSSTDFLGAPVIRLPCSADFATGRGLLQLLCVSLPSCCRFSPRQSGSPLQSGATIHTAFTVQLPAQPLGPLTFEATSAFTFVTAQWLTVIPKDDLVDRLQRFSFLPPCYPSYEASDFCPGGDSPPTEHASIRWTHVGLRTGAAAP